MSPALRKSLLVAAVVLALGAPASQALLGWGLSAQEFSFQGDNTLQAAGYAFSIWGLIYAGFIAHAAFQITDRGAREPLFRCLAPGIIAIAGCGLWIIASGLNARWASVAIIVISAASAWFAAHRSRGEPDSLPHCLLGVWPIAVLGGWLLAASALNILTVMTAEGLITPETAPAWAIGGIATVVALTGLALWRRISAFYAAPVVWALIAVFVAERPDQPTVAFVAAAGAVVTALFGAVFAFRNIRG